MCGTTRGKVQSRYYVSKWGPYGQFEVEQAATETSPLINFTDTTPARGSPTSASHGQVPSQSPRVTTLS